MPKTRFYFMLNIGIFGLGTVGRGLIEIIRKSNANINIKAVVDRSYQNKKDILQDIPASDDSDLILKDKEIDVVVELIGGIDLPLYIARETIDQKRKFVTANKALLAEHGYTLFNKAFENWEKQVFFEAAVAGGMPIIRNLQTVFRYERITRLEAILNGTSNYILTKMHSEKRDYADILKDAQALGLAEADPTLDVNGMDATHKLCILASLIQGEWLEVNRIETSGISELNLADIVWSESMGYRIKLIAKYIHAENKNYLSVEPTLVKSNHFLYDVELENNAIMLDAEYSSTHLLVGKGAGSYPTAYSVFTDIMSSFDQPPKVKNWEYGRVATNASLESEFYIRYNVKDQTGVLASIANILGQSNISISNVKQDARLKVDNAIDLVISTHKCSRGALQKATEVLNKESFVEGPGVILPIDA